MYYLTNAAFILMNLVAAGCCLAVGPRGPGQSWRYLAALGFALGALASGLFMGVTFWLDSANPSIDQNLLWGAMSVVNVLLGLLSTGLTVAGVLLGRSHQAVSPPGQRAQQGPQQLYPAQQYPTQQFPPQQFPPQQFPPSPRPPQA